MTTPGIPNAPQIIPRQAGESDYAYRKRRSIALTGETPYQRRKRLGAQRGLSVSEARGHAPIRGESEYQRRRRITLQQTGLTPSQLRYQQMDAWLAYNGFSPATTGFSQTKLRTMYAALRWMNESSGPGGQITPALLYEASQMEFSGDVERDWTVDRVLKRYAAMREFKEMNDKSLGNFYWFRERIPDIDTVWWYYH